MIRIGTDCSGIEAPIQALKQLKIPFKHVWSCEIDKFCQKSIKENYEPDILYTDITKRDNKDLQDIDLYVAGFPCQAFSNAGKKKGLEDERGTIFWNCLDVIKTKKPTYFILENVKAILSHNKGKTWEIIWNELQKLKEYKIQYKIMNTKDYGLPQNRERLYIVGTKGKFTWPKKKKMKPLKKFVSNQGERQDTSDRHEKILETLPKDSKFIEFAFGSLTKRSFINSSVFSPCILAKTHLWCVPRHRYATCEELLSLQGFKNFKQVVSKTQMKKQIGNSMSVNVVKCILKKLLKS